MAAGEQHDESEGSARTRARERAFVGPSTACYITPRRCLIPLELRGRRLAPGTIVVAALALLAASACVPRHRPGNDPAPEGEVALTVTNHNWLDVVIYVVHDGQRSRIGIATASSAQTFILPARLLGQGREIQLLGHPIGGVEVAQTDVLTVQPGQYIAWTLESSLQRSSVGVF